MAASLNDPPQGGTTWTLRFASAVAASCLLHLTFGTIYCWGNIAPYIISYMRQSGYPVNYQDMSWVVSGTTSLQAISMCFGSLLQQRLGLRLTGGLGCCVLTLGIFLSSWSVNHGRLPFLLCYSCFFGLGMGLAYTVPMIVLMKWLPKMKGLASGIVVGGFGAGAAVFNMVQEEWVNPQHMQPTLAIAGQRFFDWQNQEVSRNVLRHVPSLLRVEAVVFGAMQILGLCMLLEPGEHVVPDGADGCWDKLGSQEGSSKLLLDNVGPRAALRQQVKLMSDTLPMEGANLTPGVMILKPAFWLLLGGVSCCAQTVLFMATSQKTLGLVLVPQISDVMLTEIAGMTSIANSLGRLCWGMAADLTSVRSMMMTLGATMAALMASLPFACDTVSKYCFWTCGIFFCIGGVFSLYPAAISTFFGPTYLGSNYGCLMLGIASSEVLGSCLLEYVMGNRPVWISCELLAMMALASCIFTWQLRLPDPKPLAKSMHGTERTYGVA